MKRTNGSEEFWSDGAIDINEFQELLVRTYINDNNSNNNRGTAQWKYFKDTPDSIYIVKNVIDYDTLKNQQSSVYKLTDHIFICWKQIMICQ